MIYCRISNWIVSCVFKCILRKVCLNMIMKLVRLGDLMFREFSPNIYDSRYKDEKSEATERSVLTFLGEGGCKGTWVHKCDLQL